MDRVQFSGNQRTAPRWLADFLDYESAAPFPAKLNPASFVNRYGVDITLGGNAAQFATSLTVTAIAPPGPSAIPVQAVGSLVIPTGSVLVFDQTTGKVAITSAPVYIGNTTISVQPLPTALVAATDSAKWRPFGGIFIPSGILVGRTFASRDSGSGLFEPATDPSAFDELYLTLYDTVDVLRNNDVELLRPRDGITVKYNYLPDYPSYLADAGLANPAVAPTMTHAGSDGLIPVGTYYAGYTWGNASGETKISPLSTVAVGSTEHATFGSVAFPAGATLRNFYLGRTPLSRDVQYQGSQASAAAYDALSVGTGSRPPIANNTKTGAGRQLDAIQTIYNTIKGLN